MKTLNLSALFVFAVILTFTSSLSAHPQEKDWDAFSENLVKAMATPNIGLQRSAMQQIVRYGDNLNVKGAVFDIVSVYRNSECNRTRQLALVALSKTNSNWAMGFLRLMLDFEKDGQCKKLMTAILNESDVSSG